MKRKTLLFATALLLSMTAFAQGGTTGPLTWQLSGTSPNMTLTISGSGEMPDYMNGEPPPPWYSYKENISIVVIGNSVNSIGRGAFYEHTNLSTVTIGNAVTFIGYLAFGGGCSSLTSITCHSTIPPALDGYVFDGCPINIPVYVPCAGLYCYLDWGWEGFTNFQAMSGNPPPQPKPIVGPTTVCKGENELVIYETDAYPLECYTLTWTVPNGWTIYTLPPNGFHIEVIPGPNAQSGTFTAKTNNGCGSSVARTLNVTVTDIPAQPGNISGSTTVCADEVARSYSISAVAEATSYTWTLPSGWSGSSTSTTISATPGSNAQNGTIKVKANSSCGSSSERTLNVTVTSPPTAPTGISGNTYIDEGESTTLTAFGGDEGGGCSYQWYSGSCGSGGVLGTSISITVSPQTTTTYYVRRIGTSGCNTNTTSCAAITITVFPMVPVTNIIGVPTNATINVPLTLTGTVMPYNASYQNIDWSLVYAGNTNAEIISGVLYTSGLGTAIVRATIINGSGTGSDYTQDFSIEVGSVGITEQRESNITISPNPTKGMLQVTSYELQVTSIEIFDIYGKNVGANLRVRPSVRPICPKNKIDISDLSAGVYFLKINTETGMVVKKVLKE